MQYHAKLPENNSNVSSEHPLKEFIILLLGSAAVALIIYWALGLFIDIAVDTISPEMEIAIYEAIAEEGSDTVLGDDRERSDKEVLAQNLVSQLSQCVAIPYPIKLTLLDSEIPNAFAAPGGEMVMLSGLLTRVQSENGLAFVLAHELAHFKNRDHLRGLGRGVVLMALSVLTTGNSGLSRLMAPVSSLEAAQFSQSRERAADAAALDIINCHYGHISGATEFFKTLAKASDSLPLMHYFSSHPEAKQRIAAINTLGDQKGYQQGKVNQVGWIKATDDN